MLDQAFHTAQTRGPGENLRFRRHRHRCVGAILHFKRKHPAEHRHLLRCNLMGRVRSQSRIMHTADSRVAGEKIRNFHRVLGVRAHPPWQGAHAPQN